MNTIRTSPATRDGLDPRAVERAVAGLPGVRDVAATVHRRRSQRAEAEPEPAAVPVIPRQRTGHEAPRADAIVHGPPPLPDPGAPRTLQEALTAAARLAPGKGTTFVLPGGGEDRQTYAELLTDATAALGGLQRRGLRPGQSVLLQCADSRSFLTAFWACVLGGFLPTPVGPAPSYTAENAVTRKLRSAWQLLGSPLVVTDEELRGPVGGLRELWGEIDLVVASVAELSAGEPGTPAETGPDDPVLNLLTSGSTGTPKCVRHRNRSIVARTLAAVAANGFTADDVSLNWMPLDHVGGIVMYNVRDVFLRCEHVNARTESFVQRPVSWLDWIDRFRATNTWAPNFAFALVAEHADAIERGHWDLSSMRNICNAGEAVVARTAHRFLELTEPHGLPADAMVPCWGMSETSSGVTYGRLLRHHPSVGTVGLDPRSMTGRLAELPPGSAGAVTLTEVGPPVAGVSLRIVGDTGEVLPEGTIGRLHVRGDTLLDEYFGNPAANAAAFTGDGWFDTGDLAFLRHGRLILTGRLNDMIIVNGANFPAHDLESVAGQVPGVRSTGVAVCGVHDDRAGTDAVVVFFVPVDDSVDLGRAAGAIRGALARETGIGVQAVVPVPAERFPKTASGKIQRGQLVEAYVSGSLTAQGAEPGAAPPEAWLCERVFVELTPGGGEPDTGPVLYLGRDGDRLPAELTALGVTVLVPRAGDLRAALLTLEPRPARVVYAAAPAEPGDPASVPAAFLATVQAVADVLPGADLTVVTRGACGADARDLPDPAAATLVPLVRTARSEGLLGGVRLVDLDGADGDPALARLLVSGGLGADVYALRGDRLLAERLGVVDEVESFAIPKEFLRPGGNVVITGGLGGLGVELAEYLLAAVSARVLVLGRTPVERLGADKRDALRRLREAGDIAYEAVDVTDAAGLRRVVAGAESGWGRPADLVLHLAGADVREQWDDLPAHALARETEAWLRHMLAPKLDGAAALGTVLAERPDTAVIVFSSVNGFLGGASYGAYAAANAGADAFATRWAADGRSVRCVAWSMWTDRGMNRGSPLTAAAERIGLRSLDPARGLALLLTALNQPRRYLIAGVDPDNDHLRALLSEEQLAAGVVTVTVAGDGISTADVERAVVEAAGEGVAVRVVLTDRRPYVPPEGPLEERIVTVLERVLRRDGIGRDDGFFDLGGDSIRAMQTVGQLNEHLGTSIPVSLLYDYPTPRELGAVLAAQAYPHLPS